VDLLVNSKNAHLGKILLMDTEMKPEEIALEEAFVTTTTEHAHASLDSSEPDARCKQQYFETKSFDIRMFVYVNIIYSCGVYINYVEKKIIF